MPAAFQSFIHLLFKLVYLLNKPGCKRGAFLKPDDYE